MQLFQSNLMDLVRAEIGGSHPSNREPIPRFSVRQRPDARVGSAMWRIVVSHKGREFSIGGNDLIVDCGKYRPEIAFVRRQRWSTETLSTVWQTGCSRQLRLQCHPLQEGPFPGESAAASGGPPSLAACLRWSDRTGAESYEDAKYSLRNPSRI